MSLDGADAVAAVVLVIGFAVGEAHHGGDDVGGGDVGDVEAFHDVGWFGEAEEVGEIGEVLGGADGGGEAAAFGELSRGGEGAFEGVDDVAEAGGFFEVERFGGGVHFVVELVEQGAAAFALEDAADLVDALVVLVARNFGDAGGGAIADEIVVAVGVVVGF